MQLSPVYEYLLATLVYHFVFTTTMTMRTCSSPTKLLGFLFCCAVVALHLQAGQVRSFGVRVATARRGRGVVQQQHVPAPVPLPLKSRIAAATAPYAKATTALSAVPKRHKRVPGRKRKKLYRILFLISAPIRRPLSQLGRAIFRHLLYHTSQFVTALMIDPGVNHAIANGIKDGMNLFCTQPNVKDKLVKLQRHLSESGGPSLSKELGEDFPKTLLNFIVGVLLQGWDEPEKRMRQQQQKHKQPANRTQKQA